MTQKEEVPSFEFILVGNKTGVLDKNSDEIRENDQVMLFGKTGRTVFAEGAYGIYFCEGINWDLLEEKVKEYTGNHANFCMNDNFISFWEIKWNFNCFDDCCGVVEIAKGDIT